MERLRHSLLYPFLVSRCATVCCVAFHSWVQYMSCFCSLSTCDQVSNSWNTFGTSGYALVVHLLSVICLYSHVQMWCFPLFRGHSKLLDLLDSSAFEAKVLVFGFSWFWNLFLSNYEFVGANKFSLINALEASHSLKTIKLPLSSRRSCIYGNHFSLSCGGSFLVVELSPPSDSWSDVYPSWVKMFTTFVTKFANLTMLVELSCQIGGWVCISLNWALTITSDLPYFSHSISQAW